MDPLKTWHYTLSTPSGAWVADVILREDGFFATVSDWGDYAFRWRSFGACFRAFAARITPDYVEDKLRGESPRKFAKNVWPLLAAAVRAELDAERAAVSAGSP